MPTEKLTTRGQKPKPAEDICLFAQTNFRNQMRRFGIKTDDRRRHMYIIGKTGMGKTTMMENMVLNDIYKGHGVGVVDPHGDFAEKIIDYIPTHRINDVVYFNPADTSHPIGFNILEVDNEEQKHLVVAGLMGTFKKIWPDVWSSRMEYILNNTLLALLDYPNTTLLGINRMLGDKSYRKKVVKKLKDPVIKSFWVNEFANYNDRYQQEAVAPIQNKIGQFLSANVIRNMVAQVKSTINVRDMMDNRKIFIMNLSKGRIGEDNSRLLGGMLITKIQLAAMERVDTPEEQRQDFFLYVDEFQNFATPSFANILSEARKYRLSLIMAHQYVAQLDEVVADAVFGNVGTIITFRVGGGDAEALVKEFTPTFLEEDIVNLAKFNILLKLMINGVASLPFSAQTMPPIGSPTGSAEKVIRVSRERYSKPRASVEDKILRWSGLGEITDEDEDDEDVDEETTNEAPTIKPAESKAATTAADKKSTEHKSKEANNNSSDKSASSPNSDNSDRRERQSDADEVGQPSREGSSQQSPPQKKSTAAVEEKKQPGSETNDLSLADLLPRVKEKRSDQTVTFTARDNKQQKTEATDKQSANAVARLSSADSAKDKPTQPRHEQVKTDASATLATQSEYSASPDTKKKKKRKRKRKRKKDAENQASPVAALRATPERSGSFDTPPGRPVPVDTASDKLVSDDTSVGKEYTGQNTHGAGKQAIDPPEHDAPHEPKTVSPRQIVSFD